MLCDIRRKYKLDLERQQQPVSLTAQFLRAASPGTATYVHSQKVSDSSIEIED